MKQQFIDWSWNFFAQNAIRLNELKTKSDHETEEKKYLKRSIFAKETLSKHTNLNELQWQRNHRNPTISQYCRLVSEKLEAVFWRECFGGYDGIFLNEKVEDTLVNGRSLFFGSVFRGIFLSTCLLLYSSKRAMFAL